MSDFYVRKMAQVQSEHDALLGSLQYVQRQWQKQNLSATISNVTFADIERLRGAADEILFIRLFSQFEGILKENLSQHHSSLTLTEDIRAVDLINRAAQRQTPAVSALLREKVHEVRRYRNFLVHPGGITLPVVTFTVALARLSKFVDYFPEPF